MSKNNLEERLIKFAKSIIDLVQAMPENKVANHLGMQLLRSGTSTALNYGEAQSGESKKDFIHKINIVLKELRESNVCLRLIDHTISFNNNESISFIIKESDELIAIFVKSVQTAKNNLLESNGK